VRRKADFVAEEVGAPMAARKRREPPGALERMFRKPSEILPMQLSDFRGFPQDRFGVLKILDFRTDGFC
jgi:hypothetical protein